jgi:hypothetical protein
MNEITVDKLAQEIRRVDGGHNLGAGQLAEALMPMISAALAALAAAEEQEPVALQSVNPVKLNEAMEILSRSSKARKVVTIRPQLADSLLASFSEQAAIIDRFKRTSASRELAFQSAMLSARPASPSKSELAEARRLALEEAAAYHDEKAAFFRSEIAAIVGAGGWTCNGREESAYAHEQSAKAIRALANIGEE